MGKMKIKNLSNFRISIDLPNVRFKRDLMPHQESAVPDDVIEDFNYDPGCISLVQDGFLKIISDDEEVKAQAPVTTKKTASDVDVRKIVVDGTPRQLYDLLKNATPALKDLIVETAIKNNVVDPAKRNFIKAVTGVDILNALAITQVTITPTKG